MRTLVLGATGRVGRRIVEHVSSRGHDLSVLVRDPGVIGRLSASASVVQGDARDLDAVSRAVAAQDAVLYALGAGNVRRTTLFSESTRVLLEAMERHHVNRLICVTGVGAGDTKGHGGFVYDWILYPLFTRGIYADKDIQEELIRRSAVEWTIVRPAPFRQRAATGPLHVVTQVAGVTLRAITPDEVARFVVDELEQRRYVREAVFVGHQ